MPHICRLCNQAYEWTSEDQALLEKVSPVIGGKTEILPIPTVCADCRQQELLAQTNEIYLFERKCDATGEDLISNYPAESKLKIFSQKFWYSDAFDAKQYGRDYDFSRSFFEQWHELILDVPRPALFTEYLRDLNCAYTNYAGQNKNCFLIFDADLNQECYYSYGINTCKSSVDCFRSDNLELCVECVDCKQCYNCSYTQNSENCVDSMFLKNCVGLRNCIACSNLVQKEYHVFNKPVSKEQFEKIRESLKNFQTLQQAKKKFAEFCLQFPQRYMRGIKNENVVGNYLTNSKNAHECFDCRDVFDCRRCTQSFMALRDCMDTEECGESQLLYRCTELGYNAYRCAFSFQCLTNINDLLYCTWCLNGTNNCFGCVGLKKGQYCILNKQYTKEEYEALLPRIVEHMKQQPLHPSGELPQGSKGDLLPSLGKVAQPEGVFEWGEFLPMRYSTSPYNITLAQWQFPLSREEALEKGLEWHEDNRTFQPQTYVIPDKIGDVQDDILKVLLACEQCGKNFRVIPQELKLYRQNGIPIPHQCFYCRHAERMAKRNPRKLWNRNCDKCGKEIQTSFAPDRPEKVYCESCYLAEVY